MGEGQNLEVGMVVLIKRSDGSLNRAYIAEVNQSSKMVMVQWEESGECKGKEVCFSDIYQHNIELKNFQDALPPKPWVSDLPPAKHSRSNMEIELRKRKCDMRSRDSRVGSAKHSGSAFLKEVERARKSRDDRRSSAADKKVRAKNRLSDAHREFAVMIDDFRKTMKPEKLSDNGPSDTRQITVCVRKRPFNLMEKRKYEVDVISVLDGDTLILHEPKTKVDLTKYLDNQYFKFDYVFDESCDNDLVYKYTAKPLVNTVFEGGFSTCFAYGQTGSGKTFTMGGDATRISEGNLDGIYAKTAMDIFRLLESPAHAKTGLIVTASYFEIYREKLYDLLAGKAPLKVLEDTKQRINIVGLTEREVCDADQLLALIKEGNSARTSCKTMVNQSSSRSHAVFQITLKKERKVVGKFCLIDLAGNERGGQTLTHTSKMEGADINKSLLALKECIRALGRKDDYLPFRGSKLTQVLRDAFIGDNAKTCMIAMLSPGISSSKNTLNTLRYANRVKELECGEVSGSEDGPHEKSSNAASLEDSFPRKSNPVEQTFDEQLADYLKMSEEWTKKEKELYNECSSNESSVQELASSLSSVLLQRLALTKQMLALARRRKHSSDL